MQEVACVHPTAFLVRLPASNITSGGLVETQAPLLLWACACARRPPRGSSRTCQFGPATSPVLSSHVCLAANHRAGQCSSRSPRCGKQPAACESLGDLGLFISAQPLICTKMLLCVCEFGSVIRSWQLAHRPEEMQARFPSPEFLPLQQAGGSPGGRGGVCL